MPRASLATIQILSTVHIDLSTVVYEVMKEVDCKAISGLRLLSEQQLLYAQGRTMPGPIVTNCDGIVRKSNHQSDNGVGNAVDVVPYPIDWTDKLRFYHFAGFLRGVAFKLGIEIDWGGDWDSDYILNDQDFYDLPHYERRIR